MLKVQILDRCPYCNGESMVFVRRELDANGKLFDRQGLAVGFVEHRYLDQFNRAV